MKTPPLKLNNFQSLLLLIGGGIALKELSEAAGGIRRNTSMNKIGQGNDTSADLASRLRLAMYPYGKMPYTWMPDGGTDEAAVFKAAAEIQNFGAVAREYARLYGGDDLLKDLQNDLDAEDYERFIRILRTNNAVQ